MQAILQELQLQDRWKLVPMLPSGDLRSSDLGAQLAHGLEEARQEKNGGNPNGSVVFLGMDSPELPLEEIEEGLKRSDTATLCPAGDGGYGMLCLPAIVPSTTVFSGVRWSHPLTALSQLKALTDLGIPVRLGRLMNDIDEPDDLQALANRLMSNEKTEKSVETRVTNDVLLMSSPTASRPSRVTTNGTTTWCHHTKLVLKELDLLIRSKTVE